MKNLILLFLFFSVNLHAQKGEEAPPCVIMGPSEILVGQTVQFSINPLAQCAQCYDWDVNSFALPVGLNIVGDDRNNVVDLAATAEGTYSVRVTYFTETGCHTCIKTVTVIEPCFNPVINGKLECGEGGFAFLTSNTLNLSQAIRVTWIFDPADNPGYYAGFQFTSGGTVSSGGLSIVSTDPSDGYLVAFSMNQNALCPSNKKVCFRFIVDFIEDSDCEEDIWIGEKCGNLTIPAPIPLVSIFPNPTISDVMITLEHLQGRDIQIELYDLHGTLVQSQDLGIINSDEQSHSLNLSKVYGQIAWLKIVEQGKVIQTKKILISK